MSDIPIEHAGSADASAFVQDDIACRKCAYNLRGLSLAGRCPECGSPVGVSVQGNLLRYSDPAWIDALAKGLWITLWAIVASLFSKMLVQDGVVKTLNIEGPGKFEVSDAATLLAQAKTIS